MNVAVNSGLGVAACLYRFFLSYAFLDMEDTSLFELSSLLLCDSYTESNIVFYQIPDSVK